MLIETTKFFCIIVIINYFIGIYALLYFDRLLKIPFSGGYSLEMYPRRTDLLNCIKIKLGVT